jgi:RNA 2',3'-cyclic 3'-phosphodiesterase
MRLFVAAWLPPDVVSLIAALPRPDVPGLRWTTEDQWHVTLRFLGDADLDEARGAFSSIDATAPMVSLGPATGRFGRRILHVPTSGLDEVAAATVAATASVGEPPEPRPFKGHVTLARSRRGDTDLRPLCGTPIAATWVADEITLVRSHLGAGVGRAAQYEIVASLPLR